MKQIDYEKFLSTEEREQTEKKLNVFFDKDRKYKRHADGLRLIKQIVQPMAIHNRMRQMAPEVKERIEEIVKQSYSVNKTDLFSTNNEKQDPNQSLKFPQLITNQINLDDTKYQLWLKRKQEEDTQNHFTSVL